MRLCAAQNRRWRPIRSWHLRAKGARELEDAVPSAALRRYAGAIPAGHFADATDANVVWLDLRPWCLGRWLTQQPSGALAHDGCCAVRRRCSSWQCQDVSQSRE
jgi:hypothetical protein